MSEQIDLNQSFKAYDVRGVVGETLDAEAIEAIGAAFVDVLSLSGKDVLVGGDMRPSSAEFAQAFARGATYRGANVVMLGLISTDELYFASGKFNAAGVVFTVPALIFLVPHGPAYFSSFQITMLAFAGGILGVLMMVPLRRALIVNEHGVLPYPEGTACANVLVAGERGGALAGTVFAGLGVGLLWKSLSWIVQIVRTGVGYSMPRGSFFPNATINIDVSPEYLGVGYVIGPRIAGVMFAGGVLSWLVLLPLLTILGEYIPVPFPPVPASGLRLSEMGPSQIWSATAAINAAAGTWRPRRQAFSASPTASAATTKASQRWTNCTTIGLSAKLTMNGSSISVPDGNHSSPILGQLLNA